MMQYELIGKVLKTLGKELESVNANSLLIPNPGDCDISIFGKPFSIVAINILSDENIRGVVRKHSQDDKGKQSLLITELITSEVAKKFRKDKINYCDSLGNLWIQIGDGLVISKEKNIEGVTPEPSLNLNTISSLKILFTLLQNNDSLNWTLRRLADVSGVSLGTAQRVMEILRKDAMVFHSDKGRHFANKKRLLDIWVNGFNSVILPKITMGRAMFRSAKSESGWEGISMEKEMQWGGEPAAWIYDRFLVPEKYSLFTSGDLRLTIKQTGLIPVGATGKILILKKFWKDTDADGKVLNTNVAPVLIVYAQLMGEHDSRCAEAAERLLKNSNYEE